MLHDFSYMHALELYALYYSVVFLILDSAWIWFHLIPCTLLSLGPSQLGYLSSYLRNLSYITHHSVAPLCLIPVPVFINHSHINGWTA
jgi:hypothetical protein